ncbi:beta-N-acetylhexosaminidase [Sphaerisporangium perillae]|uniref:beta-N-acetylhexosaminidase n=1 Tax=Sphaerisporangium perillae TaxID=2935860 RepID=UPI00200D2D6F|nr:beta-N-acetylhexosaminidase [Sphaerisporangium perillae]
MTIPRPERREPRPGTFTIDRDTGIAAHPALAGAAAWLRGELGAATGYDLAPRPPGPGTIVLALADPGGGLGPEDYRLAVDAGGARVEAVTPAGAFYGAQTLRQLLPAEAFRRAPLGAGPWILPAVRIEDGPRFPWRGCLLDVARNFMPKAEVLRFIDLLAMHKLNVLHLHLTDDQGWRVEIERHPRLTEVGAWRRESQMGWRGPGDGVPHGGFYTQRDIREIVAYAAARHITVVPEIDIPGHTQAAIAAYPELGNLGTPLEVATTWGVSQNVLNVEEATVRFFLDVFDEVLELFPSPYICVGGDECRKDQWRASPAAHRRIAELGLRDEEELQSWFIGRFDAYLADRGRRMVGWDEILEGGLAPGAVVASWRSLDGAVSGARAGHDVINCLNTSVYLDYRQSDHPDEPVPFGTVLTLAAVHAFDPVPGELDGAEARHVLGSTCCLWTELIDSGRRLDYMAFPRLAAFAEAMWSRGERDFEEFRSRLAPHLERLDAIGVEYRREDGPLPWQTRPGVPGRPEDLGRWLAHMAVETSNIRGGLT